jgi:raffinose/stachyose/melibiose transport system permease protein
MFTFSLKNNSEILGNNIAGLPKEWVFENYSSAILAGNMALYFFNSIVVTGFTILITLILSLMAVYALTRLNWKGRDIVYKFFMLGLTVPIHASILPLFIILRYLNIINSYQALVIPYAGFALATGILIGGGFIVNIPKELEESACIDGCGVFEIFFRIILPLMKPAMSTIIIFTFLQAWNELMFAVVFINQESFRTLTVGIQTLSGSYTTDWGPIGAALVMASLPTLIMYSFIYKRIQNSLILGAIKG